jgi:hypothetical protein
MLAAVRSSSAAIWRIFEACALGVLAWLALGHAQSYAGIAGAMIAGVVILLAVFALHFWRRR